MYTVGRGDELLILGSEVPAAEQGLGGVALHSCGRLRGLESGCPSKGKFRAGEVVQLGQCFLEPMKPWL